MNLYITEKAKKDLQKLDENTKKRIKKTLDGMSKDTRKVDIKKVRSKDEKTWRLRVGDYRVFLTFESGSATIIRVMHRKDAYK